jgi:WhiB family redox-sensing transcriptional regulator
LDESMLARLMATVPGADLELSFAGEWRAGALCRREAGGSVNFFPARGENYRPALVVCSMCAVKTECRDYALQLPTNPDGIWGGLTERERRRLRRG